MTAAGSVATPIIGPRRVPDTAPSAASTPSPAAFRAVQVLEVMSGALGVLSLSEIAARVPLPKSSTCNILVTLEAAGMVRRSSGGWLIGYRALEIGQSVLHANPLVGDFRRAIDASPALAQETVLLAVLDGTDVLYLARHDGREPVRLGSDIGRRLPAVVTALGKAMLAALPADDLEERLASIAARPLPRPTRRSHRTISGLRHELLRTRRRGFAVDTEENTIGITCFAIPVTGTDQPTAVSTTLPTQRLTPGLRESLVAGLADVASAVSGSGSR